MQANEPQDQAQLKDLNPITKILLQVMHFGEGDGMGMDIDVAEQEIDTYITQQVTAAKEAILDELEKELLSLRLNYYEEDGWGVASQIIDAKRTALQPPVKTNKGVVRW